MSVFKVTVGEHVFHLGHAPDQEDFLAYLQKYGVKLAPTVLPKVEEVTNSTCTTCNPELGCRFPEACPCNNDPYLQAALANVDRIVEQELAKQNQADEVVHVY